MALAPRIAVIGAVVIGVAVLVPVTVCHCHHARRTPGHHCRHHAGHHLDGGRNQHGVRSPSCQNAAVELHNSGSHNGKTLDEDVVNVLTIRDGEVTGVGTNLADV